MNIKYESSLYANDWWESKRLKYNLGLIISGIIAFIFYCLVFEFIPHKFDEGLEISLFTIFFQGIGYLFMMIIANLFYFLGAYVERKFKPMDKMRYRYRTFALGFWFSVSLPFLIPIIFLIQGIIYWLGQ